ncbi:FbpB family small basic protein [Alkalihalophilus sp. As8PL]|uniref:FbpB family small basic protein n=1 Tax=Alkalihalophilus sp. As8PL TaxID=3237103 RepID=A0AB39BSE4_9BACI
MRKVRKVSFEQLVRENKEEILNNKQLMEKLEDKWERRHAIK